MASSGLTLERSEPYVIDEPTNIDIKVESNISAVKNRFPRLDDDSCEYLSTGKSFYLQLIDFDGFMLHSSAVVVDGKAYLFTADSGTGKSTHTNLWLNLFGDRAYVINDDKPALRLENGVWYVYGTPWSGKHNINVNTRVPLAGIACLERGKNNVIEPFSSSKAIALIFKQISKKKDADFRMKLLGLLDKLFIQIPVWKLSCNMDIDAAIVAFEAMAGNRLEESNED